jgi:hypothetical protein
MGKKKKKLSDIKDALLSNTSYLNAGEKQPEIPQIAENQIEIDRQVLSRIKLLANYYGKDHTVLINEALTHFLRLKKLDVDEALKNVVIGNKDDE